MTMRGTKMDATTRDRCEARARVLKALAHPTRLFIVDELGKGARCVCELQAMIGADMSTVSKHLAQLKSAGIVEDEKRGAQVFYSLRATCVPGFLGCVEKIMREQAERQIACVRR
jgi:DNA-binding transcriptional ArsR family regulator